MAYEKGSLIDCYKVSMLLKSTSGTETYRVRDKDGKLQVLKLGVSAGEKEYSHLSDLFEGKTDEYILYRYVNGETLEKRVERKMRLSEAEATEIAEELLRRLSAIHQKGACHCQVTPDNVMLDLTDEVPIPHLVGFGRVRKASEDLICRDLKDVGKTIHHMLHGTWTDRVKVKAGMLSRLEAVMFKALQSEFISADEMLLALQDDSPAPTIRKSTSGGFSLVAGMDELKERLQTEVIDILANKADAEEYGIEIPNGMLLYGPPGCGKTFLAERFAEESGYNYRYVKSSDLASTYIHGSQEKIAALFDEARKNSPTILCFDEFDALTPRRDDINNASHSAEVNEFLSQLNNCGRDGVFVIATTNRPDRIDSAILRTGRMDYIVYIPLPDRTTRRVLFEKGIANRPHESDIDFQELAEKTEGMIASDITAIVQRAARTAFSIKTKISMDMLISALRERRPSLSKSTLAQYEKLREGFESHEEKKEWKKVGFK